MSKILNNIKIGIYMLMIFILLLHNRKKKRKFEKEKENSLHWNLVGRDYTSLVRNSTVVIIFKSWFSHFTVAEIQTTFILFGCGFRSHGMKDQSFRIPAEASAMNSAFHLLGEGVEEKHNCFLMAFPRHWI